MAASRSARHGSLSTLTRPSRRARCTSTPPRRPSAPASPVARPLCLLGWSFNLLHDFQKPPPFVVRQRAGLHDRHPIAHRALVLLIVHLEPGGLADGLLVARVLLQGLHPDHDGLVHPVGDDRAHPRLPHTAFGHAPSSFFRRRAGLAAATGSGAGSGATGWLAAWNCFSIISVRIWASVRRTCRICRWFSSWPVAIWNRRLKSSWREDLSCFSRSGRDMACRSLVFISCPWSAWPAGRPEPPWRRAPRQARLWRREPPWRKALPPGPPSAHAPVEQPQRRRHRQPGPPPRAARFPRRWPHQPRP